MNKNDLQKVEKCLSGDINFFRLLIVEQEQAAEHLRKLLRDMEATHDDLISAIYGDEDAQKTAVLYVFRKAARSRPITSSDIFNFATRSKRNVDAVFYAAEKHRIEIGSSLSGDLSLAAACDLVADALNSDTEDLPF